MDFISNPVIKRSTSDPVEIQILISSHSSCAGSGLKSPEALNLTLVPLVLHSPLSGPIPLYNYT